MATALVACVLAGLTLLAAAPASAQVASRSGPDLDVLALASGYRFDHAPRRAHAALFLDQRNNDFATFAHGLNALVEFLPVEEVSVFAEWGFQYQSSQSLTGARDLTLGAKPNLYTSDSRDVFFSALVAFEIGFGKTGIGAREDFAANLGFAWSAFVGQVSGLQASLLMRLADGNFDVRGNVDWFHAIDDGEWVLHAGADFSTEGAPANLYVEADLAIGAFLRGEAEVGNNAGGNFAFFAGWVIPFE